MRTPPRSSARLAALTFAFAFLAPRAANAHEYWLHLSNYSAPAGTTVRIGALAGTGFRGEWKPWSPNRAVRFVARAQKQLDLAKVAGAGDLDWARFAPSDAGGAMFGFESNFTPIELPAPQFDDYLRLEGLDAPLAARRATPNAPGRERYRRSVKAWLAGSEAKRASEPLGLPLEIVPLAIPGAGATLSVRVLFEGRPLAGALLKTWRAPATDGVPRDPALRDSSGSVASARTDARGEARFDVTAPGQWLVGTVQMVPSRDRAAADWESTWASLTFVRAAAPAAKP